MVDAQGLLGDTDSNCTWYAFLVGPVVDGVAKPCDVRMYIDNDMHQWFDIHQWLVMVTVVGIIHGQ